MNFIWHTPPDIWRYFATCLCWFISFSLPYGERTPYWLKFIVGCTFTLPLLFIGLNFWMILTPVLFISMFWLSNKIGTAGTFLWKIVEGVIGMGIGVATAYFVKNNELLMILCFGAGSILFPLGGLFFKPFRRFILPVILTIILFIGLK